MADANIKAVITAKDEASSVLKSFGDTAGNVGSKIADVAKVAAVGIAAAGAAAIGFGVVSVKAFSESEDLITQTNAALKSTGQSAGIAGYQITQLAEALQKTTAYSDEQVRSVENLLLTFTNVKDVVFKQATPAILDLATAMHEDLQSATIQVGKALNDPVLGITALHRIGVTFSETQKKQIKNFVDTNQVAKAQGVILAELTKEFGGSAVAAGSTFSGQLQKLKNSLNDVEEKVGGVIVGALTPFATKALEAVAAIDWTNIIEKTITVVKLFFDAITGNFPTLNKFQANLQGLEDELKNLRGKFFDIYDAVVKVYQQVEQYLAPKIKNLIQTIKDTFPTFRDFIDKVNPVIEVLAAVTGKSLVWALGQVVDGMNGVIRTSAQFLQSLDTNKAKAQESNNAFEQFALSIASSFVSAFHTIQGAAEVITGAIFAVVAIVRGEIDIITNIFRNLRTAIADVFSTAGMWLYDAGKEIVMGLIHGIEDAIGGVGHALGKVGSDIGGAVSRALHTIHVPGFAAGVQNFSGGLAVVGEQGPELVNLPSGSSVIPNSKLGAGSAQSVNISINVGVYAGTQIELRKLATKLQDAYKDVQSMGVV